jgi:hypothetical protein
MLFFYGGRGVQEKWAYPGKVGEDSEAMLKFAMLHAMRKIFLATGQNSYEGASLPSIHPGRYCNGCSCLPVIDNRNIGGAFYPA